MRTNPRLPHDLHTKPCAQTRLWGLTQDPKTGAISVTQTPPAQDNSLDSAINGAAAGIRKAVGKALDVPKKLALEAARKLLGEAGYTALCLAIGLAGPGHAGFHLTNATGGTLTVQTYDQADKVCLVAANQYVIQPGQDATCEAKAVVTANDVPKGVQYRLNGAAKAVFMDDGALMMAVQVLRSPSHSWYIPSQRTQLYPGTYSPGRGPFIVWPTLVVLP